LLNYFLFFIYSNL